ncbi:unnamed protein product [Rotaria sordida]|uniref:DUF2059 domain-containing protein n=1 Tax=Rotaria sordida TaxID=392033 RepID=A0A819CDA6_9BILA|nr:unnamed protein product [Rotaria sordida]CAF0847405.1 unnamed protein product [Rotaria sordida]CAF0848879.1 unnamed protein product [Rotaria sordida]CAF1013530.1 unnamed protein product [Rotaria sordida]CAF1015395.1 unnamed protein product [Rotaria sordida]
MDSIRLTILIIALFFTIGTIEGKPTSLSSNDLKDNIKYLLNILEIENEYIRFLSYMKLYPPEDTKMKVLYDDLFSFDSFISDLTSVYEKYYTLDDVTQLINFYSSPLGKKVNKVTQALDKEMEDLMLNKISDYIFALSENGVDIRLPQISQ